MTAQVLVWKDKLINAQNYPDAFYELFLRIKESGFYGDLESVVEWEMLDEQKDLYQKAKCGDREAAQELVTLRQKYAYESWSLESLINPLTPE